MNFRIANNYLKFSTTYKKSQSNLLRYKIRQKKSSVQILQKEFISLKASWRNELNVIDFVHVSTLIFGIIDKILKAKSLFQQNKFSFYKLVQENKMENKPEKNIFNFSKCELSDAQKKLFSWAWTFALHINNLIMLTI